MKQQTNDSQLLAMQGKLRLMSGAYSTAGVKAQNEDAYGVASPTETPTLVKGVKGIVATVADGVSHASEAAKASAYCVKQFKQLYYDAPVTWSTQRAISEGMAKINSGLFRRSQGYEQQDELQDKQQGDPQDKQQAQWLTTFSGIVFKSATAHIFHVGDTQILRIRHNQASILTTAHNQALGNSVLTRAMGADNHLKVDYQAVDIQPGDVFILTSDGVHDYLSSQVILELVASELSLAALSEQLVVQAQNNDSLDNLTCLVVRVDQVPNQQPDEIRQSLFDKTIPPALEVGQVLEGYRVLENLYATSRSHLYVVEKIDHLNNVEPKRYILKAPSCNFEEDEIYLQGFIHEAWVGSQIDHPLIMKVHPVKTNSYFLYHICEYIEGQTLRQWMIDHPKSGIDEVRRIITQVTTALRAFERLEIVHRDLKPENLMIDSHGQIKLIDYGTASVAAIEEQLGSQQQTHPLGTVNYIAPETLINLSSSHLSDLFSVGVIAYEMLTGQLPYPRQTRAGTRPLPFKKWQYRSAKDYRDDIPFWFDLALMKAVKADPALRYQTYSEFVVDITKPNLNAEQAYKNRPLLERDPVKFWQLVSALLAVWVAMLLL